MEQKARILIVDDEEFNLKLLAGDLEDSNYEVVQAQDGQIACDILKNDARFDCILLDRMMPNMDGIEALAIIKSDARVKNIPVIMQTAAASTKEVLEGIEAGVFYYLTKPYDQKVLLAVVKSAIDGNKAAKVHLDKIDATNKGLKLLDYGKFHFSTLEDAVGLSRIISNMCPDPQEAFVGISELIINAVEHGNLGITFEEKTELMLANTLQDEIKNRLSHSAYKFKVAQLIFDKQKDFIEVTIEDQGEGFEWEQFLHFYDPARAVLPNGRGIAMAKLLSFSSMEYVGKGNKVICRMPTQLRKKILPEEADLK